MTNTMPAGPRLGELSDEPDLGDLSPSARARHQALVGPRAFRASAGGEGEGQPSRVEAEEKLEKVVQHLWTAVQQLTLHRCASDTDTARLQKALKWGRRTEHYAIADLHAQTRRVEEWRQDALTRLPAEILMAGLEARHAKQSSAASEAAGGSAADPLPMPLSELEGEQFLKDLDARRIPWETALRASIRPKSMSEAAILQDPALLEERARRRAFLKISDDVSVREALESVLGRKPLPREVTWGSRLRVQRAQGLPTDIDRRRVRVNPKTKLVPLVRAVVLMIYQGRPRATHGDIAKLANDRLAVWESEARKDGCTLDVPRVNKHLVGAFIRALPIPVRVVATDGMAEWEKNSRLVVPNQFAEYANHIWQLDHTCLDIWVLADPADPTSVVRPWVTSCVDMYSSYPLALHVGVKAPDAFSSSCVLFRAIGPAEVEGERLGGIPTCLRPDRGADFMSEHVALMTERLGITLLPAKPRHSDGKPHVERLFGVLNERMAGLPGATVAVGTSATAARKRASGLLSLTEFCIRLEEIRVEIATATCRTDPRSKLQQYIEAQRFVEPPAPENLALLLLKSDATRVITKTGIEFNKRMYLLDQNTLTRFRFHDLVGRRVTLFYHPDSWESLHAYDAATHNYLGEWWEVHRWKERFDGRRLNEAFRRDLKDRSLDLATRLVRQDGAAQRAERERVQRELEMRMQQEAAERGVRLESRKSPKQAKRTQKSEELRGTRRHDHFLMLLDDE